MSKRNNISFLGMDPETGRHPGLCYKGITKICSEDRRNKICEKCKKELGNAFNIPPNHMTLEKFYQISRPISYFIKHELRKKNGLCGYKSLKRNVSSKGRSLKRFSFDDLEMGHIFYVFQKFIVVLIKEYRDSNQLSENENDNFLHEVYSKYDFVKSYIDYNVLNRNFSFKYREGRLQNDMLQEEGKDIKMKIKQLVQQYDKKKVDIQSGVEKLSNISIILTDKKIVPINTVKELTIKQKDFSSLSKQLEYYISNNYEFKKIFADTKGNKTILKKYKNIVEHVEVLIESGKYIADETIEKNVLGSWKNSLNRKKIGTKPMIIASPKNIHRTVRKIIMDYDGDVSKLTDGLRASVVFNNTITLREGAVGFIQTLENYNKRCKNDNLKITEVSFISKFGNLYKLSPKTSGYREGKFLVKLTNGTVIEVQFHLSDMFKAKREGFSTIRGKSIKGIITSLPQLKFNPTEYQQINEIIDDIRGKEMSNDKPPYFDCLQHKDKLSSDTVYVIYRELEGYDRKVNFKPKQLGKDITLLDKLQLLEREINYEGIRKMLQQRNKDYKKIENFEKNKSLRNK